MHAPCAGQSSDIGKINWDMFKSNIVFMFDCKYDHNIYYIGSERSSIMCKNTGLRIFISLIGIVVVTIYLLNTSTDLDTIQSDIDTANS